MKLGLIRLLLFAVLYVKYPWNNSWTYLLKVLKTFLNDP